MPRSSQTTPPPLPPLTVRYAERGLQPLPPDSQAMAQAIHDELTTWGPRNFVELSRLDGFAGDEHDLWDQDANVLIWPDISRPAHEAIHALLQANIAGLQPTSEWCYLADGGPIFKAPIAHGEPPAEGFKRLHWMPTRLALRPADEIA